MNSSSNYHCPKNKHRFSSVSSNPICECCSCNPCNCCVQPPISPPVTSGVISTGAIWRNPATETIVITILNNTNTPQTVTVSVLDWQNCVQAEMRKEAFLCGEPLPSLFNGIPKPLTVMIPAKKLLVIHATPQFVWQPGDPYIVNTWEINNIGIPQEGNTVLHHQFRSIFITCKIGLSQKSARCDF